jgi:hypothetical protein
MPEDETLEEEGLIVEPFMVEDKDDADEVCLTCSTYKSTKVVEGRTVNMVCASFKLRRDYEKSKGKHDTEETFCCSEYTEGE